MRVAIIMEMHIRSSVIFVESSVQGMILVLLAQMPLSHDSAVISGFGQQL